MTAARLAILWLLFLVAFLWGMATIALQVFPFQIVQAVWVYTAGGLGENTTLREKLANDLGRAPVRWFRTVPGTPEALPELAVEGLKDRRVQPRMALSPDAPEGYRAVFGAFDFEETLWGAILFDPEGQIVRTWALSTDDLPQSTEPAERKNMYGVDMRPDGSILYLMQEDGGGIVKVDACGQRDWVLDGIYHHTITPTDRGTFWTYEGTQQQFDHVLMEVDTATGEILRSVDMGAVREANPDVHIWDLQREEEVWDRVHGNDIEELSPELAAAYPGFEAGDLVMSYRVPNLVFVFDPETLQVKWWRVGPWDRQHDPDFGPDGWITVFSNNERGVGSYSKIIAIDPETYEAEVKVDGADYDFFTEFNGTHQRLENDGFLLTSSHQGRIFEVDANGSVVFDFVNLYQTEDNVTLHVGDAMYFAPDYFERGIWDQSCPGN